MRRLSLLALLPLMLARCVAPDAPRADTPASFAPLAQRLTPSVVNISTTTVREHPRMGQQNPLRDFFGDEFFDRFFGGQGPGGDIPRQFRSRSLGSGFILDAEGHILTNNHVVAKADEIAVRLSDRQEFAATVVGTDPQTDLALIRIDPQGARLQPVTLGDSEALRIGDWVLAIGNPFGYEHTVTAGILGAKGRVIGAGPYDDFLQTDAAINPGNSGGPLFDMSGLVVGINTAIVAGGQGIGFAIPVNLAKQIVAQLQAEGKVTRGWLGVRIQEVTPELAERFGLDEPRGALVAEVTVGSPAEGAGLRRGDIILEIDGQPVQEMRELPLRVAQRAPGTKVSLTVLRDRERTTLSATLGELEGGEALAGGGGSTEQDLGLTVQEITPELRQHLELGEAAGVVITQVAPGSPAAEAGLRRGQVIAEVNRMPVEDLQAFRTAVRESPGDSVLFLVQTPQGSRYVVVKTKP